MKNKKKLNNKGVTLIELLIGVAILGIIIGPLLAGFMMSTRTNAHSKQMGMATTAAQNVMEKIRGLKLTEEIVERLVSTADEGIMISSEEVPTNPLYQWNDKTGKYVNCSDKTEKPVIRFIEKTEVNGVNYVAEVTLDRTFETKNEDGDETEEAKLDEYTDYNNEVFASISSMNSKVDCSFLQTSTMDNTALELFSVYPRDDVKNNMTRKIIVTLGGNKADAVDKQSVTVQIDYTYKGITKSLFPDPKPISGKLEKDIRNVFIYYTPYTPDEKYIPIDNGETIEIVNKEHGDGKRVENATVYIVCQNSEKQGNKINYVTYQAKQPKISLIEDDSEITFSGEVATKIRVGDSLFYNGTSKIDDVFTYSINNNPTITSDEAKEAIGITNLGDEKVSDKAYNVTVRVYPAKDYTYYEDFIDGDEAHFSESVDTITGAKERQ